MTEKHPAQKDAVQALASARSQSGTLVSFSAEERSGWIEGSDGELYFFSAADVVSDGVISIGDTVRFSGADGLATEISDEASVPADSSPESDGRVSAEQPPEPQDAPVQDAGEMAQGTLQAQHEDAEPGGASGSEPEPSPQPKAAMPSSERGKIVSLDEKNRSGWIQSEKSKLYSFSTADLLGSKMPNIGQSVLFTAQANTAVKIALVSDGLAVATPELSENKLAAPAAKSEPDARLSAAETKPASASAQAVAPDTGSRPWVVPALALATLAALAGYFVYAPDTGLAFLEPESPVTEVGENAQNTNSGKVAGGPGQKQAKSDSDAVPSANTAVAEVSEVEIIPIDRDDLNSGDQSGAPPTEIALAEDSSADTIEPKTAQPTPKDDAATGTKPAQQNASKNVGTPEVSGDNKESTPEPATSAVANKPTEADSRPATPAPTPAKPPRTVATDASNSSARTGTSVSHDPSSSPMQLSRWWPDEPQAGVLNLRFAGHLAGRPAIVLAFDGVFGSIESATRHISVTASNGGRINSGWEIGPNATSLILPVSPGYYNVALTSGLQDAQGKQLSRSLSGPVRVP